MVNFSTNKTNDIQKLRRKVKRKLDQKRYLHTLGVSYTAAALAMCYEADIKKGGKGVYMRMEDVAESIGLALRLPQRALINDLEIWGTNPWK